jgi:hypothetical protein
MFCSFNGPLKKFLFSVIAAIFNGRVGHNFQGTIPAKFGLIWFNGFRGEDLNVKVYDIPLACELKRLLHTGKKVRLQIRIDHKMFDIFTS